MRLVWTPEAVDQIEAIRDYIARDSERTAQNIVLKLLESVDLLTTKPRAGRPGRISDTREMVVSATPYIIVYRTSDTTIEILSVRHGRRRWPRKF